MAVDFGSDQLKWVCAHETQGHIRIDHLRLKQANEPTDDEISSFLSSCYDDLRIADRRALCSIASHLYIAKNVDMPSNDLEEIKKIVTLHAGRYTPYSREEIVIDFLSSQVPGQHYTNVLLIIINRAAAERFLRIFEAAGVYLEKIVVSAEAMTKLHGKWLLGDHEDNPVGSMIVDYESSDITISDRKQMVFVRNIPIGARQLKQKGETHLTEFLKEIKQSFATYQDLGVGRPIERFVMTGLLAGDPRLEGEIRGLMAQAHATAVQFKSIPYVERFMIGEEAMQLLQSEETVSFFDLFSVVTMENEIQLNLVPEEVKLRRKVKEGGRDIVTLGIVIMTCLLLVCLFLFSKIYLKNSRIQKLDQVLASTSAEAQGLQEASTKTRVLRELLETRGKGLYVFEKLSELISDDIYLSSFSYDQEGALTIKGTADAMSRVFAFVTDLEESVFFKDVETKQTQTRKEKGKEVADFEIGCNIVEI